jgi:hypothetical protein
MGENEFLAANPRNWDERVPIHRRDRSGFYAVERFLAGDKHLHAIELGELGDVAGGARRSPAMPSLGGVSTAAKKAIKSVP